MINKLRILALILLIAVILTSYIKKTVPLDNTILFLIISIGALMNLLAVFSNGKKMPVFYDKKKYTIPSSSKTYFFFSEKRKVRLFYFCDILKIVYRKKDDDFYVMSFSIGDIIIVSGIIILLLTSFSFY